MTNYFYGNKEFDIHQFEWFLPSPPRPVFSIKVSNENGIYLNKKLRESVPKHIKIGINLDGTSLGLAEVPEKGYRVPKNGMIKDPHLVQLIEKRGIRLPASYLVEKMDELWLATLVPSTPAPTTLRKTPKNPRKNGLRAMLPKNK